MTKSAFVKIMSIGFLTILCIMLAIYLIYSLSLRQIQLSEQKNTDTLGLFAVKSTTATSTSLITYRVRDAKTETFSGEWKINFIKPDEIILFGAKADAPQQQYFINITSQTGQIKDISKLPGSIIDVAPSQLGTYLLLNGIKKTSTSTPSYYLCVVGKNNPSFSGCRTVLGDIIDKKTQDAATAYHAYWNKEKDNEMIIQEVTGQRRIWTYDAASLDVKVFDIANRTLPFSVESAGSNTKEYAVKRFGTLAIVTSIKGSGRYAFFLPKRETLLPLSNHFALAIDGDKISLIDMAAKTKSEFAILPAATSREIISYYE